MRSRSLRSRLLAATLASVGGGLAILVVIGNLLFASTVHSDNSQKLSTRLEAEVASLATSGGRVSVRNTLNDSSLDAYGWVYTDGHLIDGPSQDRPDLNAAATALAHDGASPATRSVGHVLLGRRRIATGSGPTVTVVAGIDTGQLQSLQREVLIGSIALALLVLAGVALTIHRVLAAALAPVLQMTRDADDWEAHDLERRFDQGPARDELTSLAATLDHLLDRIAASRRHEQRFAAEVAHELRTPLAAIRASAELAAERDANAARMALSDIVAHSQRMATTLDTLIAAARRETSHAASGVDLTDVLADFPEIAVNTLSTDVSPVEGEANLLRQIFAPLIDNARRYANSEVSVTLDQRGGQVFATVHDDGPGVDPDLGVKVFLAGIRGAGQPEDGAGLGLPLAQRLAHSCGGEIRLGQGPGGCFVVVLPATRPAAPIAPPPR